MPAGLRASVVVYAAATIFSPHRVVPLNTYIVITSTQVAAGEVLMGDAVRQQHRGNACGQGNVSVAPKVHPRATQPGKPCACSLLSPVMRS